VIFGATRGHRSCALFRTDTYLRDRVHHRTVRLAPRLGPSVPLGITNGGRFVVLAADIGPRGAYHRLYLLDRRHGLTDLTLLLPPHRHRFWDRVYLSRNAAAIAIGVGDRTFVYHRSTGSMDLAASANLVVPRGISMDGRFMAVIDRDPGLLGPSDRGGVFRLDTATQDMARADVLDTGPFPEDVWLYHAAMSADGSTIAFSSAPLDDSFRTQAWVRTGLPAGS